MTDETRTAPPSPTTASSPGARVLAEELPAPYVNQMHLVVNDDLCRLTFGEMVPNGSGIVFPRAVMMMSFAGLIEISNLLVKVISDHKAEKAAAAAKVNGN